jgi:hypothetical protein
MFSKAFEVVRSLVMWSIIASLGWMWWELTLDMLRHMQ